MKSIFRINWISRRLCEAFLAVAVVSSVFLFASTAGAEAPQGRLVLRLGGKSWTPDSSGWVVTPPIPQNNLSCMRSVGGSCQKLIEMGGRFRDISGTVLLPQGMKFSCEKLVVNASLWEAPVDSKCHFVVSVSSAMPSAISVFSPEASADNPAMFLSETVYPWQDTAELSVKSTARDLVTMLGGFEYFIPEDLPKAVALADSLLLPFSSYLEENLRKDSLFLDLEKIKREDFRNKQAEAIKDFWPAFEKLVDSSHIRRFITNEKTLSGRVSRKINKDYLVQE